MHIDPTLVSPVSALFGAIIGGCGSLLGAIYTQHRQTRLQRIENEASKRETVYAEFVTTASNLLVNAYIHDSLALGSDEQRMIGILNRMRLFAPPDVIAGAEAVLKKILAISLRPRVEFQEFATEALSKNLDPDPLLAFGEICRADLDSVRHAA